METDDCVDLTGESMSNLTSSEGSEDDLFQCHVTGYDRSNGDNRNVIIPYDDFILFLDNNFVCKTCKKNKNMVYERQTCGIATSINMICSCGTTASIKAKMRSNTSHLKQWQECTLTRLRKAGNFELNAQLLMALQQCGQGENDAAVYAGMLNLSVSPIHAGWMRLEEEIELKEIQLGEIIINENIELERKMTIENKIRHNNTAAGCVGLLVQGDTRWHRRSSGHAYNSDSGASILVGNQSS
jgi:rubredoxin